MIFVLLSLGPAVDNVPDLVSGVAGCDVPEDARCPCDDDAAGLEAAPVGVCGSGNQGTG